MSISVNENGTLKELSTIHSNENGTLKELSTVHANEDGTLVEIYSGCKFPTELTWYYSDIDESPHSTVATQNGVTTFSVSNSQSAIKYRNFSCLEFQIKGNVKVTLTYYLNSSGSGGASVTSAIDGTIEMETGTVTYSGGVTVSGIISDGTYYVWAGGGGGNQYGSYACSYSIEVSFEKA